MSYYEQIDPIGESDINEECKCCGVPDTSHYGYCSRTCYNYDLE